MRGTEKEGREEGEKKALGTGQSPPFPAKVNGVKVVLTLKTLFSSSPSDRQDKTDRQTDRVANRRLHGWALN